MAFFVDAEQRQRHKLTDTFLDQTREALTDPAVTQTLHETTHASLTRSLETLYVPNVRHDTVMSPRKLKDEYATPVLAIGKDETLTIDPRFSTLLPAQKDSTLQYLRAIGHEIRPEHEYIFIDRIESLAASRPADSLSKAQIPEKAVAYVRNPSNLINLPAPKYGKAFSRFIRTRPMLFVDNQVIGQDYTGLVGIHELVHVSQAFKKTTQKNDEKALEKICFEDELMAYHVEAVAIGALYARSANPTFFHNDDIVHTAVLYIDQLRRDENANRKNKFEPTGKLRKIITEAIGSDIVG